MPYRAAYACVWFGPRTLHAASKVFQIPTEHLKSLIPLARTGKNGNRQDSVHFKLRGRTLTLTSDARPEIIHENGHGPP
jgi:hypothetical protein